MLVTNNLKDFNRAVVPAHVQRPLVVTPDDFFCRLVDLGLRDDLIHVTTGMAARCKNPPLSWLDVLDRLAKNGLTGLTGHLLT